MRDALAAVLLTAVLSWGQAYRAQPGGPLPSELSETVREALEVQGVRVVDARGYRFCEVWLRAEPMEAGSLGELLERDAIPQGVLVGVVVFHSPSADRYGRGLPRGVYTLRFVGEDSVALLPAAADRELEPPGDWAALRKGLLSFTKAPGGATPRFEMNRRGEWILHLRAGETPIALLVAGVAGR